MTGFERDVGQFEMLVSTIYMKETEVANMLIWLLRETLCQMHVQKLKRRINLKGALLTVLTDDMKEVLIFTYMLSIIILLILCQLVDEMTAMHQAHLKLLEKMQLKAQLDDLSASQQDKLAEEVKKIWMSAIRRFKKGGSSFKY